MAAPTPRPLLAASGQARWFWLPLGTSVAMDFVNLVGLVLLAGLLRREGPRPRDMLGFDRTRLGRDLAWSICWLVVLNGVYTVGLMVAGGAGLIYLRQGRLIPPVLAHFVTNLPVTFIAVAFLFRL